MASDGVLDGDVAIVTGAGRNIGRAVAERFADEGASVVGADIDGAAAEETAERIVDGGGEAIGVPTDITVEAEVVSLVEQAEAAFGPADVLVNNVAITDHTPFYELSVEEFDRITAVNLRGTFLCTREVAKSMRDAGGGRIVNVASTSGHKGRPTAVAYTTTKAGILNFTRSVAKALAPDGIRVNTLSPTRSGSPVGLEDERSGPAAEDILVDRWGRPEDQANAALFLVSPESEFVCGTELLVDGGSLA